MSLDVELLEKGFVDLGDLQIGCLVEKLGPGCRLLTQQGLAFLKIVLHNESIQNIAASLLGPCKLAHWLRWTAWPEIEGFRIGGQEAGLRVLLVLALSKGSRVTYYQGSHLHDLPLLQPTKEQPSRGLPQTTEKALKEAGCIAIGRDYPDGGLVVLDARLWRKIQEGYVIKHALVANDTVNVYDPKLVVTEDLKTTIEDIQSTIGINYVVQSSSMNKS